MSDAADLGHVSEKIAAIQVVEIFGPSVLDEDKDHLATIV